MTSITNYALTYIDSDGNRKIYGGKSNLDIALQNKPLYNRKENAEKAARNALKVIKDIHIPATEYWINKGDTIAHYKGWIKRLKDYQNILENGFDIKEVTISIDLSQ
jgi:hypothetical protein